jgi:hypothetical protein
MKTNLFLSVSALAIVFSGCTVKVGQQEPASDSLPVTLDGTWATPCMANSNDSYVKSFKLEDGTLTVATLQYSDTRECDQAKLNNTVIFSGKLTVTGDSAAIEKGHDYEWQIEMIVGIPYDQTLVDSLNAGSACGSNSWAVGQAGVLLSCNVAPGFDLSNVAYGTKHYGTYVIQENVTPLYMQFESKCAISGYDFICPTAADRPATTDGTVFVKQ